MTVRIPRTYLNIITQKTNLVSFKMEALFALLALVASFLSAFVIAAYTHAATTPTFQEEEPEETIFQKLWRETEDFRGSLFNKQWLRRLNETLEIRTVKGRKISIIGGWINYLEPEKTEIFNQVFVIDGADGLFNFCQILDLVQKNGGLVMTEEYPLVKSARKR
jgi:hypothetical protein